MLPCGESEQSAPVHQTLPYFCLFYTSLQCHGETSAEQNNDSYCTETALLVGSPSSVVTEELQLVNLKITKWEEESSESNSEKARQSATTFSNKD